MVAARADTCADEAKEASALVTTEQRQQLASRLFADEVQRLGILVSPQLLSTIAKQAVEASKIFQVTADAIENEWHLNRKPLPRPAPTT